jgi:hypothetical protein
VRLGPLGTSTTNRPIAPAPNDRWWWMWSIGGIRIGRGNRSTRRKPAPAPLSHHKSHMTRSGFEPRTAAVGSQRLTAWAMARPSWIGYYNTCWLSRSHSVQGSSCPLISAMQDGIWKVKSEWIKLGLWMLILCLQQAYIRHAWGPVTHCKIPIFRALRRNTLSCVSD